MALACLALAACEEPAPRTFADFMEDRIAMDGTLARCNENRDEAQYDIECANASRAQAALALERERERRAELERESKRKIEQLTREMAERQRIAREAAAEALRQEREAYERRWNGGAEPAADPAAGEPPGDRLSLITLPDYLRVAPAGD